MAHESFEDDQVAALVNRDFVAIKVDREERPDVDAVYMTATQAMTGQGGWPMTVFATPDGRPFFCGTYFPRPNFMRLLESVSSAWRDQRDAVVRQGNAVVEAIAGRNVAGPVHPLTAEALDTAVAGLAEQFDEREGGFGGAPKFPPHLNLLFLLRHYQRTGNEHSLEMVRHTCERMARGGIHDQIAGGFARYSVDAHWTVPHFEKMLYDNALLLRVYTHLWRLTADPLALRVADGIVSFLDEALATPTGGLASALDADTEGQEGLTYVWTPAELTEVLGEEEGAWVADLCGVTPEGTFEHGRSVLRMMRDIDAAGSEVLARWLAVCAELAHVRSERAQPVRDDKIVAAWNGLAVTALVEFASLAWGLRTDDVPPGYRDAEAFSGRANRAALRATRVAELLARVHIVDGRLRRVSRDGVVGASAGVLEDHGAVAEAFCAMHELTGEGAWLERARLLLDAGLEHFADGRGGFHDTADDAEELVTRPADPTDNATPSGLSAMAAALTTYAALTGESRYREAAERALATVVPLVTGYPRFAGYACAVGEALLSGPFEIAVAGGGGLLRTAWRLAPPGAVIVAGAPDQPGVPLLAGRSLRGEQPTAYVCRNFVCDRPVTDPADLADLLTPAH